MTPPRPRKELDSRRIQNSVRANIFTIVSGPCTVLLYFHLTCCLYLKPHSTDDGKKYIKHFRYLKIAKQYHADNAYRVVWRVCRADVEIAENQIALLDYIARLYRLRRRPIQDNWRTILHFFDLVSKSYN